MKRKEKGGEVYIEGFCEGEKVNLFSVHKWAVNRAKQKIMDKFMAGCWERRGRKLKR